jgi:hypothetical protein
MFAAILNVLLGCDFGVAGESRGCAREKEKQKKKVLLAHPYLCYRWAAKGTKIRGGGGAIDVNLSYLIGQSFSPLTWRLAL